MPFDPLPTAFGLWLVALGAVAVVLHQKSYARVEEKFARGKLEEWERGFYHSRHRRRLKVAALLIFVGVAIPVGDAALVAAGPAAKLWFTAYLAVIFAAVVGLLTLAGLDWFATTVHTRDRLADVQAKRVALERALLEYQAKMKRPTPEPDDDAPPRPARLPRNRLRDYQFDD
ncbi:MAG: hypothetical protein AAF907_05275 [Planctomycetota bacterium]